MKAEELTQEIYLELSKIFGSSKTSEDCLDIAERITTIVTSQLKAKMPSREDAIKNSDDLLTKRKGLINNSIAYLIGFKDCFDWLKHHILKEEGDEKDVKTCLDWMPDKTNITRCANCGKNRWSHPL